MQALVSAMHFLAIEWATGELLEKYARRHGPLPPPQVADIVLQIANAVQAAHEQKIVTGRDSFVAVGIQS